MTGSEIVRLSAEELTRAGGFDCECGRRHAAGTERVFIEAGAVRRLPELVRECGAKRVFLLSGAATFAAAGEPVCAALDGAGIPYSKYVFPRSPVLPTEQSVGAAAMHFDPACDLVIGVGSGVINDVGKMLAHTSGRRYLIVATAPSMDGFASATASMEADGLKVSLPSACAWAVVGDLDILCRAPMRMLQAGVGDMAAKYISLAEWRIARIAAGEYYCPVVAALVQRSLDRVAASAAGLARREPEAVRAVTEGLVITGLAMKYAGLSRPASGIEHYFSHIWDMRALAFPDAKADLHGIQCGVAALESLRIYGYIRALRPDADKARATVARFDLDAWNARLRAFIGPGAEAMIAGEQKERKYDPAAHARRLPTLVACWPEICDIIDELPSEQTLRGLLETVGAPADPAELGHGPEELRETFRMTKDIRDKYVASRLLWDLGELDDAAEALF